MNNVEITIIFDIYFLFENCTIKEIFDTIIIIMNHCHSIKMSIFDLQLFFYC